MKYFIDSSDLSLIENWRNKLGNSFAGITTNFSMIKGKEQMEEFLSKDLSRFKTIMIQIENEEQLKVLVESPIENQLVAKMSMIEDKFKLILASKKYSPLRTSATTCYGLIQINQAIEMGMDYSMVYYAKNNYKDL